MTVTAVEVPMGTSVDPDAGHEPTLTTSRPRFAPIPEGLLLAEGVSDGAVRLWGILDRIAARDRLWPGRQYLADRLGCSTDTVDRRVTELRTAGWLGVRRRGQGRTNLYQLHDRPEAAPTPTPKAAPAPTPEPASVQTLEAAPAPREREQGKREVGSDTRAAADAAFAAWWAEYPRKVGKPAARKAFARAVKAGATLEQLADGLDGWAAYWTLRDDPEFVPYPATWLNQERWNDDPPQQRPRGAQQALGVLDLLENDWTLAGKAPSIEGTARERPPREVEP